jgi:hypothetical protein
VELFGSTRDEWIKEDLAGWLAPNRIYDGVPAVLNRLREQAELYIVTTKQVRILVLARKMRICNHNFKCRHRQHRLMCSVQDAAHTRSVLCLCAASAC